MRKTIRDHLRPQIAEVLARCEGLTLAETRKALREAWRYGPRKYHPYRIWLDEVRIQLKLKRPLGEAKFVPCKGQVSLFGDEES